MARFITRAMLKYVLYFWQRPHIKTEKQQKLFNPLSRKIVLQIEKKFKK